MEKYTHDIGKMKKNRLMHFQIGLIIALVVALVCVNFTTDIYEEEDNISDLPEVYEIINVPITFDDRRKIMPPPVIEVDPENLVEDEIEFEEEPEPVVEPSPSPSPKPVVKPTMPGPKSPKPVVKPKPAPALPVIKPEPVKEAEDKTPMTFVEQMPLFKKMKDESASKDDLKKHADAALIRYIGKNVKYPTIARENGIEGTVVVRFVVEKNGKISGLEVLRDPGGGCGAEAKRVVESMPKWERVGRQNGRRVRVYFTMPIKFQLDK